MDESIKKKVIVFQTSEITEYYIYSRLASIEKKPANRQLLENIAAEELKHYDQWKRFTGVEVAPDRLKIFKYTFIARTFGLTFGLKLMESGEGKAQAAYRDMGAHIAEALQISAEEDAHEIKLLGMIDEERLEYAGSVVLGLNDALVEFTGMLAGLTFAMANARMVAMAGAVTGIAASLSMAASEFLSTKSEGGNKSPIKASVYTGIAYFFTVCALILPYILLHNLFGALTIMLINAVIIIFIFTFYISVAKNLNFRKRFYEMVCISLGVAGLSFLIGLGVRALLKVDI